MIDPVLEEGSIFEHLESGEPDDVEVAALALGTARVEASLPWLVEAARAPRNRRQATTIVAAVALLRIPGSVDALVGFVGTQRPRSARVAIEALEPYLSDASIAERVRAAAASNPDPQVAAEVAAAMANLR